MPSLSSRKTSLGFADWVIFALAAIILFFGLYFIIGGVWLAWLGGSWYYILCGIVLFLSGFYLFRRKPLGAWLYLLAWAATIPWTIYEVGFDWWGWLPRLFGPTLLAIPVVVSLLFLVRKQREYPHA
ncbi:MULTISPECIES: glycerol dehydrogenase [Bombella]|uniref:Glycerol dehydrogenase n=1 Tax=Bombella pollinis TaxID=2967337 RepID=A0ABT3WJM4_9PROT|nr:glycerol dehydrogenase [Bombella pollinis]MCT6855836.1 glycerol dehydrogenase [Bombella apis]MCX5619266.1 glycerol dehydrogenase [Bombella pollinis]